MKKISLILALLLSTCPLFAADLSQLNSPKPLLYRMGLTDDPEVKYSPLDNKIHANVSVTEKKIDYSLDKISADNLDTCDLSKITYADLSIKRLSKEIEKELSADEREMMADLSLLWHGAATQSDTINFALYKLSNPEEDKPDSKSIKSVLGNIASMSTLAGATMGSPMLAAGSLLGGNLMSIFAQDTKALNYKYTKVNDADMIILVRKVEELQQKTVDLYYDYMTSRKKMNMLQKMAVERKKNYDLSQTASREILLISDAYYRNAVDSLAKATSEFYTTRATLEQFVGHDIFVQFEDEINSREKK
ncbi:MAG: hypothetical protein NC390_03670 [Fusobacterium sp.]|nr:hypothetical protein [Fusobacterium sp.]